MFCSIFSGCFPCEGNNILIFSSGTLVKKAGANKAPMVGSDGELIDERLKHIEPKMIELVMNEVL